MRADEHEETGATLTDAEILALVGATASEEEEADSEEEEPEEQACDVTAAESKAALCKTLLFL